MLMVEPAPKSQKYMMLRDGLPDDPVLRVQQQIWQAQMRKKAQQLQRPQIASLQSSTEE